MESGSEESHFEKTDGHDPEAVPEFVPIRNELYFLAKYWQTQIIDNAFKFFCLHQPSGRGARLAGFGGGRIDEIAACIGDDLVKSAVEEAVKEYGRTKDAESWRIFMDGTEDERQAVYLDVEVQMSAIAGEYGENDFYASLLKFLAGEPHDIKPGTIAMAEAQRAKMLVDENAAWAEPERKDALLRAIHNRD